MSNTKEKFKKDKPKKETKQKKQVKNISNSYLKSPKIINKAKQKYIQEAKDRSTGQPEQAPDQVEQSGKRAIAELTVTSGHAIRQGRDYAKRKAKEARDTKHETDSAPADDPIEAAPPPCPDVTASEHSSLGTSCEMSHPEQSALAGTSPAEIPPHTEFSMKDRNPAQSQLPSTYKERRRRKPCQTDIFPKERRLSETEVKIPPLESRQSQQAIKPLRERPTDFKIKKRPPIDTPKTSGKSLTTPAASRPRRPILTGADQSASDRLDIPTAPSTKDGDAHMKPQMAVPMEQRRAFLERKKASPYTTQEPVHTPHTSDPANIAQPPIASPQIPGKALPRGSSTEGKQTAIKRLYPAMSKISLYWSSPAWAGTLRKSGS